MNQQEFDRLLETYGAQPRRWPAALRDGALTLLETSAAAREALATTRRLDAALDLAVPEAAAGQVDRVVERTLAAVRFLPQDRPAPPLLPGLRAATARWLSAGILSGAVAAGFAFGLLLQVPVQGGAQNSALVALEEAESTALSLVFARSLTLYAEAE